MSPDCPVVNQVLHEVNNFKKVITLRTCSYYEVSTSALASFICVSKEIIQGMYMAPVNYH